MISYYIAEIYLNIVYYNIHNSEYDDVSKIIIVDNNNLFIESFKMIILRNITKKYKIEVIDNLTYYKDNDTVVYLIDNDGIFYNEKYLIPEKPQHEFYGLWRLTNIKNYYFNEMDFTRKIVSIYFRDKYPNHMVSTLSQYEP